MKGLFVLLLILSAVAGGAQTRREDIHSDFVLYNHRVVLEKDLRERVVDKHFSAPLDSDSEDGYLSACWAVEQFLFDGPVVRQGFDRLFAGYATLGYDTKRAFLEALYAVEPSRYVSAVRALLDSESSPHLWALGAVYLHRADSGVAGDDALKIKMVERFPGYDSITVLRELMGWLGSRRPAMPDVGVLLGWGRGFKTIYSFQRWDRDYPGMAVVQYADGSFARDADGQLQVFQQLARSGPGLPYFLTNGNTPQGVYSITGTDVSRTDFIGPTPNLQLLLPGEGSWGAYFHDTIVLGGGSGPAGSDPGSSGKDSLNRYLALLPPSWRDYKPMMEAWAAGAIGRTEIIAHGTTIDPEYYKGQPFYPLTPTMGCLCAKELWNPTSGHLLVSEQNNLVNAFVIGRAEIGQAPKTAGRQRSDGRLGYLIVVNIDDRREPVSRAEVEQLIKQNPR